MILRIDHIELVVHDLDEHIAFFEKLGFQVINRTMHHGGSVEMRLPGPDQVTIEMHQIGAEEVPGWNHIAFAVEDVAQARDQLLGAGVPFETNPASYGGPILAKSTGRWLANFRTPDGWRLQLASVKREKPSDRAATNPWAEGSPTKT
jgi:glyoxylase I family protein